MIKVSVICAVKNRFASLSVAVQSWLLRKEIDEIIIVDWSSDKEIKSLLELDNRIKIIRVDDQKYFHLAGAYNLASDFVKNDLILKLDADYLLTPCINFFNNYNISPDEFLVGFSSSSQDNIFYVGLSGLLFIHAKNFKAVCGYNEYMYNWGGDDGDLYKRLKAFGLTQRIINFTDNCVIHMPHPSSLSVQNYEINNRQISNDINKAITKENKYRERVLKREMVEEAGNYSKIKILNN